MGFFSTLFSTIYNAEQQKDINRSNLANQRNINAENIRSQEKINRQNIDFQREANFLNSGSNRYRELVSMGMSPAAARAAVSGSPISAQAPTLQSAEQHFTPAVAPQITGDFTPDFATVASIYDRLSPLNLESRKIDNAIKTEELKSKQYDRGIRELFDEFWSNLVDSGVEYGQSFFKKPFEDLISEVTDDDLKRRVAKNKHRLQAYFSDYQDDIFREKKVPFTFEDVKNDSRILALDKSLSEMEESIQRSTFINDKELARLQAEIDLSQLQNFHGTQEEFQALLTSIKRDTLKIQARVLQLQNEEGTERKVRDWLKSYGLNLQSAIQLLTDAMSFVPQVRASRAIGKMSKASGARQVINHYHNGK